MKKFIARVTMVATPNNLNFIGATQVWYYGRNNSFASATENSIENFIHQNGWDSKGPATRCINYHLNLDESLEKSYSNQWNKQYEIVSMEVNK